MSLPKTCLLKQNFFSKGFTLIELMVTIAIIAILAAIATPSYQALVINSRMTTQASEFFTTLEFARSEAVKRNTRVTVCKSTDGLACSVTSGDSASWQPGWIVFVDGGATVGDIDAGDAILKVHGALTGRSTFVGNTAVINFVSYASNGQTATTGAFTLCSSDTARAGRSITLTQGTGRASSANAACS